MARQASRPLELNRSEVNLSSGASRPRPRSWALPPAQSRSQRPTQRPRTRQVPTRGQYQTSAERCASYSDHERAATGCPVAPDALFLRWVCFGYSSTTVGRARWNGRQTSAISFHGARAGYTLHTPRGFVNQLSSRRHSTTVSAPPAQLVSSFPYTSLVASAARLQSNPPTRCHPSSRSRSASPGIVACSRPASMLST
jgi:hypothetical protein